MIPKWIDSESQFKRLYKFYTAYMPPRNGKHTGSSFYEAFYKGFDGIRFKDTNYIRYTFDHVSWKAGKHCKSRLIKNRR